MPWRDRRRYDGAWHEGKRHGQGVMTEANGDRYEGGWHEGKRVVEKPKTAAKAREAEKKQPAQRTDRDRGEGR